MKKAILKVKIRLKSERQICGNDRLITERMRGKMIGKMAKAEDR